MSTADHVGARLGSRHRLKVSVDEWNVWYQSRFHEQPAPDWEESHPLIEDTYDVTDAAVVGSLLITLLRHADRVGIACQAQLVNVIAPIRTRPGGPAWRQTIFHPFAQAAALARGHVLRVEPEVATYESADHGDVPYLDATATHDDETGALTLLAVNRSTDEPLELTAQVRAFSGYRLSEVTTLGPCRPHAPPTPRTTPRQSSPSPTRMPASPTDGSRSRLPARLLERRPARAGHRSMQPLEDPMNPRSPFVKPAPARGSPAVPSSASPPPDCVLAGCGGEGVGGQSSEGVGGFSGEPYDGPQVTLSYWNGFTGGDGPAMQDLVKRFMAEHDNIVAREQHRGVGRLLPAAPRRGAGRARAPTSASCTSTSWRPTRLAR